MHERVTWEEEIGKADLIHAIIFMVSLPDYAIGSHSKGESNKLLESLDVYKKIATDKSLEEIPIVILFNKVATCRLY